MKVNLLCGEKRVKKKKTAVRKATTSPVWNEAMSFNVPANYLASSAIEVNTCIYIRKKIRNMYMYIYIYVSNFFSFFIIIIVLCKSIVMMKNVSKCFIKMLQENKISIFIEKCDLTCVFFFLKV